MEEAITYEQLPHMSSSATENSLVKREEKSEKGI